jgi:hypothetical protein
MRWSDFTSVGECMDATEINLFTLTRQTDLYTSDLAVEGLARSGALAIQRDAVYRALALHPHSTSAELAVYMEVDRHLPARRLPDLKTLGRVDCVPKRKCRVTGRLCVTWVVKEIA